MISYIICVVIYYYGNQIKGIEMGETVSMHGRNTYRISAGKHQVKITLNK